MRRLPARCLFSPCAPEGCAWRRRALDWPGGQPGLGVAQGPRSKGGTCPQRDSAAEIKLCPERSALVLLHLCVERHTLNPAGQSLAPSSREQRPGAPQLRRRPVIEFPNFITPLANVRSMCWGTLPPLLRTAPSPGTCRAPRRPARPRPRASPGPGSGQRGWALPHNP